MMILSLGKSIKLLFNSVWLLYHILFYLSPCDNKGEIACSPLY